ncbi:MAG: Uma2 family endonuclease [Defluviitaleaceae bacterium]|nr:Uma2 family endonuclease [Defluviitaleaceae bacterium]
MSNIAMDYPNGKFIEIINGIAIKMAPARTGHQYAVANIWRILDRYLWGGPCHMFHEVYVHLTEDNRFVPDLVVVCDKEKIKDSGIFGAPDLILEVLSHSTRKNDRGYKMDVYGKAGVKEYWIVDIAAYSIEIYMPQNGHMKLDAAYSIYPKWEIDEMTDEEKTERLIYNFKTSLFEDLTINLQEIFTHILPEDY